MFRSIPTTFNVTILASTLLGACAQQASSSDDLEGVPELAAVQMQLTEVPQTEATATIDDAVDEPDAALEQLEQAASQSSDAAELNQVRESIRGVNQALRDVLGPILALVRDNPPDQKLGRLRRWGPVTRGLTEYRFFLRHTEVHDWGWRLDARVADSKEGYSRVAAGRIVVGELARRGHGVMGLDLDALSAVEPTVAAQGQILLGFRHGEAGSSIAYAVKDFTPDPGTRPRVDALLRAIHLADGFNRVRLAYHADVEGTASDAEELVLARVRHRPTVGGRSDGVVLGGDVPDGEALVVSRCWNEQLQSVFFELRRCTSDRVGDGADCTVMATEGAVDRCAKVLRGRELPKSEPMADDPDSEDPNPDLVAPDQIPDFDAADLESE